MTDHRDTVAPSLQQPTKEALLEARVWLVQPPDGSHDDSNTPRLAYLFDRFAAQRGTAPQAHPDEARAYAYLQRLLATVAPQCEPLPDLIGLCTQIDSAIMWVRDAATDKARRETLENFKRQIDTIMNNHLVEMKEGYDDSIVGFNEAWDLVRATLNRALAPQNPGDAAPESE